jgi:hypothetical protein
VTPKNKLRSVPTPAPTGRRPVDVYPKPTFEGTQWTPEVARAIRGVMRDHDVRPRGNAKDTPTRWAMFGWTLVIAGLLLVGYLASLKPQKAAAQQTYPLQRN